ncbi:hypothetical protein RDV84_15600 [Lysobacter yananisis]|uniref:Uncharacterized protein n=1 Tax=Lysobacter yananisis TaxID=1003114 RepID=A0ABY9P356_9GAMM|nr:hypothetical protein [Lysobacter yananisis]WMT01409.1 hypothetical protein RDV84_15600 [Lysobacter yananisis]
MAAMPGPFFFVPRFLRFAFSSAREVPRAFSHRVFLLARMLRSGAALRADRFSLAATGERWPGGAAVELCMLALAAADFASLRIAHGLLPAQGVDPAQRSRGLHVECGSDFAAGAPLSSDEGVRSNPSKRSRCGLRASRCNAVRKLWPHAKFERVRMRRIFCASQRARNASND